MIINLTDDNFENEILQGEKLALVDFYANWCGPCKMMSPVIDAISEELGDKIKVGKVDVDECERVAMMFRIMSIPTIMLIKKGEVLKTFIGVTSKDKLLAEIENNI